MSVTFRTNAIPLGKRPVREIDRVYSVLTPSHGKLELLAKGSRKIVSKLAGEMEQIGVLDLFVVRGRVFDRLAGAAALQSYPEFSHSLARRLALLRATALLDRSLKTGQHDRAIYDLLLEFLGAVSELEEEAITDGRLALAFEWKLFARLGFGPQLSHCVRCKKEPTTEPWEISARQGGVICRDCRGLLGGVLSLALSSEERRALTDLLDRPVDRVRELVLAPSVRAALLELTSEWSRTHLEIELEVRV